MSRLLKLAVTLLALTSAVAWAQSSDVTWKGDFETGDLSQWNKCDCYAGRIQVVTPPIAHDGYRNAVKVTVKKGDDPINASGNRNELVNSAVKLPEGTETWYRWSTMFAPNYPSETKWQLFTQWHHPSNDGSPPLEFTVYGEEIRLSLNQATEIKWRTPLVRGVWHDFMFHVKFSDDPKVGFVELWYNGKQVVQKYYMKTFANAYLKQGLYRNETISADGVVYHMGMRQGRTMASVMPPGTSPPPTTPDTGDVVWRGNFSGGNTSQWSSVQAAAADRMQIIPQVVQHESNPYAAKVTVQPGDNTSGGNRSQLVRAVYEPEGAEYYYRWSTMFPSDYPSTSNWQTFLSFNPQNDTAAAPLQLRTVGEETQLYFNGQVVWHANLERSKWLRFIVHVKFSNDPTQGFVELWYDGAPAMAKRYGLTMANDYMKLGLNRAPGMTVASTVYHDGMVQGRTLSSVVPTNASSTGTVP